MFVFWIANFGVAQIFHIIECFLFSKKVKNQWVKQCPCERRERKK